MAPRTPTRAGIRQAQARRAKLVDVRLADEPDRSLLATRVDLRSDIMRTDTVTVTPAMAALWIEKNYHGQRTLRWPDVIRYAGMMKEGRWRLTHQGIGFDTTGTLIDGQHRLWAIIEANVTVQMRVSFGVPHDAFGALDQNRVRTVSELAEAGWITARVTQIGKAMARGPVQSLQSSAINDRDPDELIAFIERHEQAITTALAMLPTNNREKGRTYVTSIVLATLARATYTAPSDRLRAFVDVLMSGMPANKEDRGAILLRELLAGKGRTDKGGRSEQYQKAQRALRAFVDRDPISRLVGGQHATTDDLFPLPESEKGKRAPRVVATMKDHMKKRRRKMSA